MATPKVTIFKALIRGKTKWAVSRREAGKRKRTFFGRKDQAEAEAARLRGEINETGAAWIQLPAAERSRVMSVWREAKNLGVDLQQLLDGWKATPKTNGNQTLSSVIDELVALKTKAGRSDPYIKNIKLLLGQFAKGREALGVAAVTTNDVESFLNARNIGYRPTLRARLSTLFKFAMRRRYRHDNPCDQLESITVVKSSPQVFTVMQLARCLVWLLKNPRGMAWFVLTTFCGLRPEEASKTSWNEIDFDEKWIRVESQTTKVRQRRIVHPMSEALAWLRLAKELGADLPINDTLRRRTIRRLRAVLRWSKWPKDVTRHSAASYWLAKKQNAAFVAEQLGHSERVLKRDYKALVTRDQARKFWTIGQSRTTTKTP